MRAIVYTRVSLDRTGEGLAVARQLEDARDLAERRAWSIVAERSDNDVSAAGHRRRPGFEAVLDDVRSGRADAVIAWSLDRLTRNRQDTVRLIEQCQEHKVTVALVRGSDIDMSTPSGRLVADVLASVARAEIETKGDRQRRANEQAARAGRPPGGRRAFGYEKDAVTLRPVEAELLREAYRTVIAGGSLRGVARRWNDGGVLTSHGGEWTGTALRRVLQSARYAGLRSHRGQIVGPGAWPAVVEQDTWRAAQHVLAEPGRSTVTDRSIKFLLTNIAECGRCDDGARVATSRTQHGVRVYKCRERSDVARRADEIDELVRGVVLARLARPDAASALSPDVQGEVEAARAEAVALRTHLDEAAAMFAAGAIRGTQLATITRDVEARLGAVEARVSEGVRADALAGLIGADDIATAWDGLDIMAQRAVVQALFSRVVVDPVPRGTRTFDPESIRLEWRQQS